MAVKYYAYNDSTQLSPHFNVQEFRCGCGGTHDILIAEELIQKLEAIFAALNCSKVIVNSGHRCPAYDISIGGNGSGQHPLGKAADVVCYDQSGGIISSKLVCCKAQDIGFGGIANIDSSYTATHLDVRTSNIWYGNEVVNYNTVTDDFYKYYGIKREVGHKMDGNFGIDVSEHQGSIDWQKVKAAGVKFAIIRAGYGRELTQKDKYFEQNYSGAKAAGIPVGVYWYSYAESPEDAKNEARTCLEIIKGKQFEYPIYFDLEEKSQFNQGRAACSAMIRNFCDILEDAGYWAGLYMSRSPFTSYCEDDLRTRYALWLAEYGSRLNYEGAVGMWQSSSDGSVSGVSGNVDTDYCYVDYPAMIKAAGKNGFVKTSEETVSAAYPDKITLTADFGNGVKYSGTANRV